MEFKTIYILFYDNLNNITYVFPFLITNKIKKKKLQASSKIIHA